MNHINDEKDTIELTKLQAEWLVQKMDEEATVNPKLQEALRLYEETVSNPDISKSIRR